MKKIMLISVIFFLVCELLPAQDVKVMPPDTLIEQETPGKIIPKDLPPADITIEVTDCLILIHSSIDIKTAGLYSANGGRLCAWVEKSTVVRTDRLSRGHYMLIVRNVEGQSKIFRVKLE